MAIDHQASTAGDSTGRRIGRYTVERGLGEGGMGAVYLAVDAVTGERVALKELTKQVAPNAARSVAERDFMARLKHPNIVEVRDFIHSDYGDYIALELVEGTTLRDRLAGAPLPMPEAFAVMHGVLAALDCAHRQGVVHGDVKPENVMITNAGDVKVADFGIARSADEGPAPAGDGSGTMIGTPQYMSPEQVMNRPVDGRSDIYSAGVLCYEVFCGKPPFEATEQEGPFTLFAKHVRAEPTPPSRVRRKFDPQLEAAILKALAKQPDDRYQTAADFDHDLSALGERLCGSG
jgi:serine/threonine-protein kinase